MSIIHAGVPYQLSPGCLEKNPDEAYPEPGASELDLSEVFLVVGSNNASSHFRHLESHRRLTPPVPSLSTAWDALHLGNGIVAISSTTGAHEGSVVNVLEYRKVSRNLSGRKECGRGDLVRLRTACLTGHKSEIKYLCPIPKPSGARGGSDLLDFASASADGTVRFWSSQSGFRCRAKFDFQAKLNAPAKLWSICYMKDKDWLCAGTFDNKVHILDVEKNTVLQTLTMSGAKYCTVRQVVWEAEYKVLFACGEGKSVQMFGRNQDRRVLSSLAKYDNPHSHWQTNMVYLEEKKELLCLTSYGGVTLHDPRKDLSGSNKFAVHDDPSGGTFGLCRIGTTDRFLTCSTSACETALWNLKGVVLQRRQLAGPNAVEWLGPRGDHETARRMFLEALEERVAFLLRDLLYSLDCEVSLPTGIKILASRGMMLS